MMVTDETHMPEQASDVLPSRKGTSVYHDTGQFVMGFEPAVGCLRQRVEVLFTQGLFTLHHENLGLGQELVETPGPSGSEMSQRRASARSWPPKTRTRTGHQEAREAGSTAGSSHVANDGAPFEQAHGADPHLEVLPSRPPG